MRRLLLVSTLLILLITACTVREELQFGVELRDRNLGFTVENFSMACIVTHPELVEHVNITLIDQNDQVITLESDRVETISEIEFSDVPDGTYTSYCTVCDVDECRNSLQGTVLISLEEEVIEDYEFDLPPTFILGTPIDNTYFLSERPLLVSFSCLADDDIGLSAVSLVSNVSGLFGETFIQNPSRSSHLLTKDLVLEPGKYLWTCRATDTRAQTIVAPVRTFTIGPATPEVLPNIEGFDGDTTDFSKLEKLTDVPNVIIEDTDFGKISFVDNISSLVGVDLSKGIIITQDSITVNSSLYPQLNVPARLSFYDIQLDEQTEEANIEKDGETYRVSDLVFENGTLSFTVGNFSTYTVVITPQGGYNLEENEADEEIVPKVEETIEPEVDEDVVEEIVEEPEVIEEIVEEIVEEVVKNNTKPQETPEPEETLIEQEPITTKYFNPLVLVALIVLFIAVIIVVIWLVRRNGRGGTYLRKY